LRVDDFTYRLLDNIYGTLVVQRSNIDLIGDGWGVIGSHLDLWGVLLSGVHDVVVTNLRVDGFVNGFYVNGSWNCVLADNNITGSDCGINLLSSDHNLVVGTRAINNSVGVSIFGNQNEISANVISASHATSIFAEASHNGFIASNIIETCNSGPSIELLLCSNNTIVGNYIVDNVGVGLFLSESNGNIIFHNNFINNIGNAISLNSNNTWDNGYPSGGNFWDDSNGTDLYRGPNQDILGFDGIEDHPYILNINESDTYPLMGVFGQSTPEGQNVTVFPMEDVGIIFGNITEGGDTNAEYLDAGPEIPDLPEEFTLISFLEILTTASYSGNITLRILYDDSNMTEEEEQNLRLLQYEPTPGDVDTDGDVDIFDIVIIAGAYGTTEEDPSYSSNADIDGDGDVDIFDVVIAAGNYGTVLGPDGWMDITLFVDTENNLIFARGSHLSIHGVTRRN
jgi:parallel beta-helix repeat protein